VRKQRYIRLNVKLNPEGTSESNIQMDFEIRVEGLNERTCKDIIAGFKQQVEEEIGPGQIAKEPEAIVSLQVPWWLIGATSFALIFMFVDITKNFWRI